MLVSYHGAASMVVFYPFRITAEEKIYCDCQKIYEGKFLH